MCKKPFDSIIFLFGFFLTAFAGLAATSGIALRLGGILMSKQQPENTEYPFYAAESGFFIGVKSAAFFQWMTAAFFTLFTKLNASSTNKQFGDRIASLYCQNFFLFGLFSVLHYYTLPISVRDEADCTNLREQLAVSRGLRAQNPLCEDDRSWASLFSAFFVGASLCFASFLLLQTIYLYLRAACETEEITTHAEPIVEMQIVASEPAPITLIQVMSMAP